MQNPFELIGDDEVIYQMCKKWDTPTLLNMSEAYKRVNDVCGDIITKRKDEYFQSVLPDLELINLMLPLIPLDDVGQMKPKYHDILDKVEEKMIILEFDKLRKYDPEFHGSTPADIANSILRILFSKIKIKRAFWITDHQDTENRTFEQRLIIKKGFYQLERLLEKIFILHDDNIPIRVEIGRVIDKRPSIELIYRKDKSGLFSSGEESEEELWYGEDSDDSEAAKDYFLL